MKKIINRVFSFVEDTLSGILKAYPHHLKPVPGSQRALMRADGPVKNKVAIVTGGGSGHLPVFLGYVGPGLCDGVSIGNVFSSPASDDMLAAIKAVHSGQGVLRLFGNYGGDRMNFDLAAEIAEMLTTRLIQDLPFRAGDEVAVLVNGLGATPPEELYILWNETHDLLVEHGLRIHKCFVGEYATSMEMAGCSISLLRLDDEMKELLDAPARSPFLPQGI